MSPRRKARVLQVCGGTALLLLVMEAGGAGPGQQAAPAATPPQTTAAAEGAGPHRRLADESAQLLKSSLALKSEVDKTNKNTLSISVIRRADDVEKMARSMRERHGAAR